MAKKMSKQERINTCYIHFKLYQLKIDLWITKVLNLELPLIQLRNETFVKLNNRAYEISKYKVFEVKEFDEELQWADDVYLNFCSLAKVQDVDEIIISKSFDDFGRILKWDVCRY